MLRFFRAAVVVSCLLGLSQGATAQEGPPKRLLLLSQRPDGHPKTTHEYVAGQRVLAKCLSRVPNLLITHSQADGEWLEGPELLRQADGVVLFVSEGAQWLTTGPRRQAAFAELASRGGGLTVLHWGMGTKEAAPIDTFVKLFGACHGGPDRKYKFAEIQVRVAATEHPIVAGVHDFRLKEEFYYRLKLTPDNKSLVSLLEAEIDDARQMVCWAWERPDEGRSFGFTGCHYHDNWRRDDYRRLVSQGILWTLRLTPPASGFPAPLTEADYKLE